MMSLEVIDLSIKYKIDVLWELKQKGYNTSVLRNEHILGERTIQHLREGKTVSVDTIGVICRLLDLQPGDIIEYIDD